MVGDGLCPRCLIELALDAGAKPLSVPPRDLSSTNFIPSIFGDFELLKEVGRGGMGVVYKARQLSLDRIVAVKLMLAGARATKAEIRRFKKEGQAATKLDHPNIVPAYQFGEFNDQHYIVMEYVEGRSLAKVIGRTPLPSDQALRYVKTVAKAIHYAHEANLLHRDLKPHNILIDQNDEPRITDFGLVRQIRVDRNSTLSDIPVGTPSYMPPEQAKGKRRLISPASDVYSLGAILYDCLTGRPPFRADNDVATLLQVISEEPAPPRLLNPKVDRDLETICLKCLEKEPRRRYRSAQALADDLDRFFLRMPIAARPMGGIERMRR